MFRRRKRFGGFPGLGILILQALEDLRPFFLALMIGLVAAVLIFRQSGWQLPFWAIVVGAFGFDWFYWRILRKND